MRDPLGRHITSEIRGVLGEGLIGTFSGSKDDAVGLDCDTVALNACQVDRPGNE